MSNPSLFKHGYALLVGVGADLPVTVQDAIGLRDILIDQQRCIYPQDQVKLLTESQATRQGILDGLDWLSTQIKNDSEATVVVYFSGHGGLMPNYHLVPFDYSAQDLANTAVSGPEFTEKLRAIPAQKLLILLDCCHAGGMAEIKRPGFAKSPMPPELSQVLTAGSGRVVIASSRGDEVSYTGTPYSVFTQALREGLAGYGAAERDGYAYIADVAMYVSRVVSNRTKDRQHPILKLSAADNFAIAYYAGGEKSPKPLPGAHSYLSPVEVVEIDLGQGYRNILKKLQANLLKVEDRMAEFFDEAAIPLDLERTKEGILKRIADTEAKIETEATKSGWAPPPVNPVGPTLEDVLQRLDKMEASLGDKLDNLKRGQVAIYRRLPVQEQISLEQILTEVRQGQIEQARMANTVDAIRRDLKHFLASESAANAEIKQSLADIYQAVNSDLTFQQQLELSLPVIPFLLEYKVGLGAGVDLVAAWQELLTQIRGNK